MQFERRARMKCYLFAAVAALISVAAFPARSFAQG